jgi:hypothetical protein
MRTVCVERGPVLEGWKALRWAGRMRGVWRDIVVMLYVFLKRVLQNESAWEELVVCK